MTSMMMNLMNQMILLRIIIIIIPHTTIRSKRAEEANEEEAGEFLDEDVAEVVAEDAVEVVAEVVVDHFMAKDEAEDVDAVLQILKHNRFFLSIIAKKKKEKKNIFSVVKNTIIFKICVHVIV